MCCSVQMFVLNDKITRNHLGCQQSLTHYSFTEERYIYFTSCSKNLSSRVLKSAPGSGSSKMSLYSCKKIMVRENQVSDLITTRML